MSRGDAFENIQEDQERPIALHNPMRRASQQHTQRYGVEQQPQQEQPQQQPGRMARLLSNVAQAGRRAGNTIAAPFLFVGGLVSAAREALRRRRRRRVDIVINADPAPEAEPLTYENFGQGATNHAVLKGKILENPLISTRDKKQAQNERNNNQRRLQRFDNDLKQLNKVNNANRGESQANPLKANQELKNLARQIFSDRAKLRKLQNDRKDESKAPQLNALGVENDQELQETAQEAFLRAEISKNEARSAQLRKTSSEFEKILNSDPEVSRPELDQNGNQILYAVRQGDDPNDPQGEVFILYVTKDAQGRDIYGEYNENGEALPPAYYSTEGFIVQEVRVISKAEVRVNEDDGQIYFEAGRTLTNSDTRRSDPTEAMLLPKAEINKANNIVTIYRDVNPSCNKRLEQGATGKGMNVHGKSALAPPLDGLIPYVSALSKLSEKDPSRIEHFQDENNTSILSGLSQLDEMKQKYERQFNIAVSRYGLKPSDNIEDIMAEIEALEQQNSNHPDLENLQQKLSAIQTLSDIIKETEDKKIVTKKIHHDEQGREVLYLAHRSDEIGKVASHPGYGGRVVFVYENERGGYSSYDPETGDALDDDYEIPQDYVARNVEVIAYARLQTKDNSYELSETDIAQELTADFDTLTASPVSEFPHNEIKGYIQEFFKNNPEERKKFFKKGQNLDDINIEDLLSSKGSFSPASPKFDAQSYNNLINHIGLRIATSDHQTSEELLADTLTFKEGGGNIATRDLALNLIERLDTEGRGGHHGMEAFNPSPEKITDHIEHKIVTPQGDIKSLYSAAEIRETIQEYRKQGYRLPIRPEWASIDNDGNLIEPEFDWFAANNELKAKKGSPEYEDEAKIFKLRYQIEALKLEAKLSFNGLSNEDIKRTTMEKREEKLREIEAQTQDALEGLEDPQQRKEILDDAKRQKVEAIDLQKQEEEILTFKQNAANKAMELEQEIRQEMIKLKQAEYKNAVQQFSTQHNGAIPFIRTFLTESTIKKEDSQAAQQDNSKGKKEEVIDTQTNTAQDKQNIRKAEEEVAQAQTSADKAKQEVLDHTNQLEEGLKKLQAKTEQASQQAPKIPKNPPKITIPGQDGAATSPPSPKSPLPPLSERGQTLQRRGSETPEAKAYQSRRNSTGVLSPIPTNRRRTSFSEAIKEEGNSQDTGRS